MTRHYTKAALVAALLPFLPSTTSAWTWNTHGIGHRSTSSTRSTITHLYARPSRQSYPSLETDELLNKLQSSSSPSTATDSSSSGISSTSIQEKFNSFFQQTNIDQKSQPQQTVTNNINTNPQPSTKAITSSPLSTKVNEILHSIDSTQSSSSLTSIQEQIQSLSSTIETYIHDIDNTLISNPTIGPIVSKIQSSIFQPIQEFNNNNNNDLYDNIPPSFTILSSAFITYVVVSNILSFNGSSSLGSSGSSGNSPYPLGKYDPKSARVYFDKRLNEVIGRGIDIASQSSIFGLSLLSDKLK